MTIEEGPGGMTTSPHSDNRCCRESRRGPLSGVRRCASRLGGRLFVSTFASGLIALLWLLLRTGNKPSRFTYPCQQAALAAATQAFGASLVAALLATRCGLARILRRPWGLAAGAAGVFVCVGLWTHVLRPGSAAAPLLAPPADYRAQVYHVTDCPQDSVDTRFVGLDRLVALMGHHGLKLHRSSRESLTAGPEGIVGSSDVVVIKINYQWVERGGTNVDVLRGLVECIVDHPDTFSGEIVICENAQFESVDGFDRPNNNAQDPGLSPHDAVVEFQERGYRVSHHDWTAHRFTMVEEYSAGDVSDGYVRYDFDEEIHGRVSYPKFRTAHGTYVSLKHGIWSSETGEYDRHKLKFINVPVLKAHRATYGVTGCVKNYMGVVTAYLNTGSHDGIRTGLLGALLAEIHLADLNLLDCIWTHSSPASGPKNPYGLATRRDELVASLDPVAADIWATKHILIPTFIEHGHEAPWPSPSADPDDPTSDFRVYLDNSMTQILQAGYPVTNNLDQIDVYTWDGAAPVDCNVNGIPDNWEVSIDHAFVRGNINARRLHSLDVGDVVEMIGVLFRGLALDFDCAAAFDVNDDGRHNILDPISLAQGLFFSSSYTIPPPRAAPGVVVVDGGEIPSMLGCLEGEDCQ